MSVKCQNLSVISVTSAYLTSHVSKAAEEQSEEEIEDDEIGDQDGGQEVWNAHGAGHVNAVPHGFDPLSAQDAKDDHEAERTKTCAFSKTILGDIAYSSYLVNSQL